MAKGFIILENKENFFTRWTGYDMILEIAIRELYDITNGKDLAEWLKTRIPYDNEQKGDSVFFNKKDEMVERILDLRGLTKNNRNLFWIAIKNGSEKILKLGKEYSNLNPTRITELLEMHNRISTDFEIDEEISNFILVKEDVIEKVDPGW